MGIRNPLHARQANLFVSRRAVLWRIAIAWIASVFITSPITLMSIHNHANIVPSPGQCAISNKSFMVFGSLFAFFIPMFVMVPSYVMTVRLLSRRAKFVRNDSIQMAANASHPQQQDSTPAAANGFIVRAKASSAGDCSPLRADQSSQSNNCNNVYGSKRHRESRYSSPSRTRGLSSTDLETGTPSAGLTAGPQPPALASQPVADVLRRSQKNFWAGLIADVNNNGRSEKDGIESQQQVVQADQADAPSHSPRLSDKNSRLKQPLLPVKLLDDGLESCRFIDDDDDDDNEERESAANGESRERRERSDGSQSDCSSMATIVERSAADQVNGKPDHKHRVKEQNSVKSHHKQKSHRRHSKRCGPRNACTCIAAKTSTCSGKRKRAVLNCTGASALDGRTRCTLACCAHCCSSSALALAATDKAHGASRALWPMKNHGIDDDGQDEGARSQSCTTCLLLDLGGSSPKRPRRCTSSSLSLAINGYALLAHAGDREHEDDKFDHDQCTACTCGPLTTSGQTTTTTTTNNSINNTNNIVVERPPRHRHPHPPPAPARAHETPNLCSKSCGCLHTNGYASQEQKRLKSRPHTVMPAYCLGHDSTSPGRADENKIHHSDHCPREPDNQSNGGQQSDCHKRDNGMSSCHHRISCSSHCRTTPSWSHAASEDAPSKCTISCTTSTNCVRAHQHHQHHHHHHHRHKHRRQGQESHSRPVCLCTNKRRGSPAPGGYRSARVQHAHRKSPSSRKTPSPGGDVAPPDDQQSTVAPVACLAEIREDKDEVERLRDSSRQTDNLASANQARHSGNSVIFKMPAASGEKQQPSLGQDEQTALAPDDKQNLHAVMGTGNGQLAQANHHHHHNDHHHHQRLLHNHQAQRVHGGREPPQMIRYLGSSMQVRSEQKATRVLGGVFFFFIFCWTPFFFSNFLSGILERDLLSQYIPDGLMTCFLWLGYSSSTVNPIIYTVANRNFRRAFVRLLLCREPVGRRQYRQSRSSEYYKSFRFGQYQTVRQPVVLDKE